MKPQRVALYARVSTKNNAQDPETQLIALREYAGHRGMTIIDEYAGRGHQRSERSPAGTRSVDD